MNNNRRHCKKMKEYSNCVHSKHKRVHKKWQIHAALN